MNGSVFFSRYHYTKGADAAVAGTETAASLLATPRGATRSEKTLRFQSSLRIEWSQNNLPFIRDIRGHSNPGNRFFPLSLFIFTYTSFLPSFHRLVPPRPLSFVKQLFSQLGVLLRDPGDNASSASSGRGKRAK